jgi:hypothetical protein
MNPYILGMSLPIEPENSKVFGLHPLYSPGITFPLGLEIFKV